jgi:hypothetical protein
VVGGVVLDVERIVGEETDETKRIELHRCLDTITGHAPWTLRPARGHIGDYVPSRERRTQEAGSEQSNHGGRMETRAARRNSRKLTAMGFIGDDAGALPPRAAAVKQAA